MAQSLLQATPGERMAQSLGSAALGPLIVTGAARPEGIYTTPVPSETTVPQNSFVNTESLLFGLVLLMIIV